MPRALRGKTERSAAMRNCPYAVLHGCEGDDHSIGCPFPDIEPPQPWELEQDNYVSCCGTCGTPLAYEGLRARDDYCSDRCYEIASAAADEAAENLYI
jgi:hypothetical protein